MDTELDAGMETRPDAGLEADRAAPPQPRGPDEEADFTRLYADEYPNIVRYLLRRGVGDAAPDLAAETFVVAWRRRGQWLPLAADSRTAWLYGVARLVWRNELRAGQRRSGLLRRAAADRDLGAGSTTGTLDPADLTVEQLAIAGALARLSEADQELIRLIAWEGLSPAQAAEALGCRPSALTTRLNRARSRLRTAIAAAEAPPATNPRTPTPRSTLP